jgi:SNF2 family DNA or RNA helicase
MPHAELVDDGKKIEIATTYADRYLIRQLPGATYNGDSQTWRVPLSWPACITLRGLFEWDLDVGDQLADWARQEFATRIEPAMMLRNLLRLDDEALANPEIRKVAEALSSIEGKAADFGHTRLFPYQVVDVMYLSLIRDGILANPMGLGKSASVIKTMEVLQAIHGEDSSPFPALVICPNTVKETWAGELQKFAPHISYAVITGSAGKRRKALTSGADVIIVNWESLRVHSRLAGYGSMAVPDNEKVPKELNKIGFKTVIADEAHHGKDPHSKQTRAMWALASDARYRFLLTGTPVGSHIGDLWSLLHAAEPKAFPAKTKYLDRWARVELNFHGGAEVLGLKPENAEEFRKATDPYIRRVPKEAALPQLPKRLPLTYRFTEMSTTQARLYRQMEADMITAVEGGMISAPTTLARLTRLLQFAAASATVEDTEKFQCLECKKVYADNTPECPSCQAAGMWQAYQQVRLAMPSSKVEDLVELLREMGDDPLVVGAVHTQLLNLAAARLDRAGISFGLITGQQDTTERQAAIDAFQDGKIRVLLLNIDTAGEGITLTRAWTMLFMQRHWSKSKNDQFEGRIDRIGQKYPVQIIEQLAPDTAEYRKFHVIGEKAERIEEVMRDKETLLKLLGV